MIRVLSVFFGVVQVQYRPQMVRRIAGYKNGGRLYFDKRKLVTDTIHREIQTVFAAYTAWHVAKHKQVADLIQHILAGQPSGHIDR